MVVGTSISWWGDGYKKRRKMTLGKTGKKITGSEVTGGVVESRHHKKRCSNPGRRV